MRLKNRLHFVSGFETVNSRQLLFQCFDCQLGLTNSRQSKALRNQSMDTSKRPQRNVSALIVSSDVSTRLSFHYLFSVVFEGRSVVAVEDGREALERMADGVFPETIVVDGNGMKGECLELIEQASLMTPRPVTFVLAPDGSENCAWLAFEAGADDVIRRPFELKALAYRFLVRLGRRDEIPKIAQDRLDWDVEVFLASEAKLTTVESQVLRILIHKDGDIVTRDDLSQAIDNKPWQYGDRKYDVHVAKIRKKLHAAFGSKIEVQTVHAAGYQMSVDDDCVSKSTTA